ncbi:hypothetical protein [Streptomyces sp. NPDC001815]|uniref:hypothetical protein n=1 Tax=Streptomyces sp. NPDC001815 TaxID=3154526 RepID=UPI0033298229
MSTKEAKTSSAPAAAAVAVPLFGMAQAVVIVAFLAAAVLLSLFAQMSVSDVLVLLGSVGAVGAAVVVTANVKVGSGRGGSGGGGLLKRLLSAALNNGAGS